MLGVEERVVGGDIEMQIGLMHTAEHSQIRSERCACPFARVAMHLTLSDMRP